MSELTYVIFLQVIPIRGAEVECYDELAATQDDAEV